MSKIKIILLVLFVILLLVFGFGSDMFRSQKVFDFESCVAYGNLVMESYPRQCRDNKGNSYTEIILDKENSLINVFEPTRDSRVTSPLVITGEAKGFWFFEASFPISLVDESGKSISEKFAEAGSDWMTEEFVPFSSEISFKVATVTPGFIVLKKDNPSGDPSRDASVRIPVVFMPKASTTPVSSIKPSTKKCIIGGCSGQVCSDASKGSITTTCEYREQYACYKSAVCEVQDTGDCGWTQTEALRVCLNKI